MNFRPNESNSCWSLVRVIDDRLWTPWFCNLGNTEAVGGAGAGSSSFCMVSSSGFAFRSLCRCRLCRRSMSATETVGENRTRRRCGGCCCCPSVVSASDSLCGAGDRSPGGAGAGRGGDCAGCCRRAAAAVLSQSTELVASGRARFFARLGIPDV